MCQANAYFATCHHYIYLHFLYATCTMFYSTSFFTRKIKKIQIDKMLQDKQGRRTTKGVANLRRIMSIENVEHVLISK